MIEIKLMNTINSLMLKSVSMYARLKKSGVIKKKNDKKWCLQQRLFWQIAKRKRKKDRTGMVEEAMEMEEPETKAMVVVVVAVQAMKDKIKIKIKEKGTIVRGNKSNF